MIDSLEYIGMYIMVVGTFLSITMMIIFIFKRKNIKKPLICIAISLIMGRIIVLVGNVIEFKTTTNNIVSINEDSSSEKENLLYNNVEDCSDENISENTEFIAETENIELDIEKETIEINDDEESIEDIEKEYKELCKEIKYNDIDDNSIGTYVYKNLIFGEKKENGEYSCGALEDFNEEYNFYQHTYRIYRVKDCRIDSSFPIESDDVIRVYGVIESVSQSYKTGGYNPVIDVRYIEYIRKYGKEVETKTMQEIAEERLLNYLKIEEENNYKNSLNTDYEGKTKNIEQMDELSLDDYILHCDKLNNNNLKSGEDFTGKHVCIHVQLFSHKKFTSDSAKERRLGNWQNSENIKDDVWKVELYSEQSEQYIADFGLLYFLNCEKIYPENNKKGQNIVIYGQIINQPKHSYEDWEIIVRYYEVE